MLNKKYIMKKHPYNIYPEISGSTYQTLKNDIKINGYDPKFPIMIYKNSILDGWNREKICNELNITPVYQEFDGTDAEAFQYVIRTNNRRDLLPSQRACIAIDSTSIFENFQKEAKKRMLAGKSDPEQKIVQPKTDEKIAKMFNTNREYIRQARNLKTNNPDLFEELKSGRMEISEVNKAIKKRERQKQAEIGSQLKVDIDFRLGDFETVLADIPDGSVDFIITDPPYPIEFIDVWSKLSLFAKRVLKPGGFCIAYSGQYNLPETVKRMSENLDYYWTFAMYHEGTTQIVNGVNLMCRWKPVLIYQNGKQKLDHTFQDYFVSKTREKEGHDWQQSESGVNYLIEMFTKPGDLICDCFAGSATFLIAGNQLKRNVIGAEIEEETYNLAKARIDVELKNK